MTKHNYFGQVKKIYKDFQHKILLKFHISRRKSSKNEIKNFRLEKYNLF